MTGTTKLSQDLATLINNRQGSDIQFKVGGRVQENGENVYDESTTMTLYAHSVILRCRSRYFATMLDEEKNWKENLKGVIYKPNISPSTFQDVLHYIYTGNVRAQTSENIIELIAAADEMDLEELSIECQDELVRTVKYIFSDESDTDSEYEIIGETFEGATKHRIPIDVALHTHIIPALNLASNHSLSHLSQKLLAIILPNMSVIIESPDTYITFISNISSETLTKMISSDDLAMSERNVWDLALSWACYQTDVSKAAVEAHLARLEDDDGSDNGELDGAVIGDTHLSQVKETLAPFLPIIRFSLLDIDDYVRMANTLGYFLSRRRLSELNLYFIDRTRTRQLDTPRMESTERNISSKIMIKSATWELLRKNIFETGYITSCLSFKDLKFSLLFRATEHNFSSHTFHQLCDNKGPTLTLVRSTNGHLFGGVNFAHWKADNSYSSSPLNFLFALPDGNHRNNTLVFKNTDSRYSSFNLIRYGPVFGQGSDLYIADSANTNKYSHSRLPSSYGGSEASKTALAGAENFIVSDYEVFAISIN